MTALRDAVELLAQVLGTNALPSAQERIDAVLRLLDPDTAPPTREALERFLAAQSGASRAGRPLQLVGGKDAAPPATAPRPLVVEAAADFLARAADAPQWLVPDLVAIGGVTMFHGRPRSMKSLSALALAVHLALGEHPFGAARFSIEGPLRVVYMTEEDAHGLVAIRLRWLLAGFDAELPADRLWLSARKGLSLESPESQGQIEDVVTALRPDLLIFDTGRAFAPSVDKGPSDAAGPIRFMRWLLSGTCLRGLIVVHHDTKPARDGKDERARSERMSGGALLAATDCPIGFERVTERVALAVPDRYKPSADPPPFRLSFDSATPTGESFARWLRATATIGEDVAGGDAAVREQILAWLTEHPRSSGRAVEDAIKGQRRGLVAQELEALAREGKVDCQPGPRKARLWWVS